MKPSRMIGLALEKRVIAFAGSDELYAVVGPLFIRVERADRLWPHDKDGCLILGNLALVARRADKSDMVRIHRKHQLREDMIKRSLKIGGDVKVRVVNANDFRQPMHASAPEVGDASASNRPQENAS